MLHGIKENINIIVSARIALYGIDVYAFMKKFLTSVIMIIFLFDCNINLCVDDHQCCGIILGEKKI